MNNYVIISPLDQFEIRNLFSIDTPILELLSLTKIDYVNQNMLTIACLTIIYLPILGTIINCANRWLVHKPTKMRRRPGHTYTNTPRPDNTGQGSGDGASIFLCMPFNFLLFFPFFRLACLILFTFFVTIVIYPWDLLYAYSFITV